MTNSTEATVAGTADPIPQLLAQIGVPDVRGVEILRLVRLVNNTYESILSDCLGEAPLTFHRWRVLLRIWMEEQTGHQGVNPTHLSRTQQLSKNTISDHLRALEAAGLIDRELDESDRRQFKIQLTDTGRQLIQRTTPEHVGFLNRLLDGLSPAEVEEMTRSLQQLYVALQRNADSPTGLENER